MQNSFIQIRTVTLQQTARTRLPDHTVNPPDFLLCNTKAYCVYHNKGVCTISTNHINLFGELHPAFEDKAERNNIKDTK